MSDPSPESAPDDLVRRIADLDDLTRHPAWRDTLRPALQAMADKAEAQILEEETDFHTTQMLRRERKFLRRLIARPGELLRDMEAAKTARTAKSRK